MSRSTSGADNPAVLDLGAPGKSLQSARVLIVDDEAQVRDTLRHGLNRAGYQVLEAQNGRLAMHLLRRHPADVVITDIFMPEKEGLETITELKRDFPHVKIIAISGGGAFAARDFLPIAKTLGADRTFDKPFHVSQILEAINELLAGLDR